MSNLHNTTNVSLALVDGDFYTAIELLQRIPCNHVRYAYLYFLITKNMLTSERNIGHVNDEIYNMYLELPFPYEYTFKHLKKRKGGVIK